MTRIAPARWVAAAVRAVPALALIALLSLVAWPAHEGLGGLGSPQVAPAAAVAPAAGATGSNHAPKGESSLRASSGDHRLQAASGDRAVDPAAPDGTAGGAGAHLPKAAPAKSNRSVHLGGWALLLWAVGLLALGTIVRPAERRRSAPESPHRSRAVAPAPSRAPPFLLST